MLYLRKRRGAYCFDIICARLILPPPRLNMSSMLTMLLFAVLTLPPTYHVEVAACQVGIVPKQNQPFGLLPNLFMQKRMSKKWYVTLVAVQDFYQIKEMVA